MQMAESTYDGRLPGLEVGSQEKTLYEGTPAKDHQKDRLRSRSSKGRLSASKSKAQLVLFSIEKDKKKVEDIGAFSPILTGHY